MQRGKGIASKAAKSIKSDTDFPKVFVDSLHEAFAKAADPTKAAYMKKYMRNVAEFHGLQTPERIAVETEVFKTFEQDLKSLERQNFEQIADLCFAKPHRETHHSLIVMMKKYYAPKMTEADLPKLEELVIKGAWWDITDSLFTPIGLILAKDKELQLKKNKEYLEHKNFWIRRVAIMHQHSFKGKTDEKLLFDNILKTCHESEWFIRKAIGWALREHSKTNPKAVVAFIDTHKDKLSKLSKVEGLKYMKNNKNKFQGIKLPSIDD